ncbi:MAG: DUF427 domain-containing protein [Chromatiales bacterium]|jgi:uncharacterized protein (DUF427 family)
MPKPDKITRGARALWRHRGGSRPPFATEPGPGQESVWDYPRPPAIVPDERRVRVLADGLILADTQRSVRVLETASPPTFYLPPEDIRTDLLLPTGKSTFCEWKGRASYFAVRLGDRLIENAAWTYPEAFAEFQPIAGLVAFYPHAVECWVGDERARPQPGPYYGGWVTSEVLGPFKGAPGTAGW